MSELQTHRRGLRGTVYRALRRPRPNPDLREVRVHSGNWKSAKYKKGMVVQVLVGARYGAREKVFDAVIDKVEVKALEDLSPRDIQHDNPSIRRTDELADFLSQLYNREVSGAHAVTVIRFSAIKNS